MSEHEKNVKSQLDLCRMCLASDVLLFSIANTRMQAVYEKITRTPLVNGNNRPVVVCYICHAQLQKCQKLMLLVSQSENLLLHTMGQSNEVTMKKEETCGHRANNLRPALKTTPVKYFDTSTFNIPILVKDVFEHEYLPKPEVKEEQSQSLAECMICSAVDMRTYNIAGTPLQLIYENITKTFLTSTNNRSLSACYICCSQLNKCRKLMMRSKKTETILTALIDKYSKVSTKLVDLIDLPSHNLGLPLTIRPAECCDSSDGQQLVFVEKPALKIEVKIEIEPDVYVEMANRPTQKQMAALVEFLERNPGIARGLLRTQQAKQETRKKWQEFAESTNALGGIIKDGQGWAKYWAEKKSVLKKICQQRAQAMRRTGGGVDVVPELSLLKQRLVAVMGGDSFATGTRGIAQDPFPQSNPSPSILPSTNDAAVPILQLPSTSAAASPILQLPSTSAAASPILQLPSTSAAASPILQLPSTSAAASPILQLPSTSAAVVPEALEQNFPMEAELQVEQPGETNTAPPSGSPQATEMVAYDVDNADDVNKMADAVQRDSWADVQEDYTREKLKRKRRKCIKQSKQTIENDADEPKKARPRRVYKKRIRAYVHVCQICQRVFNRTNHLKDHMKIHTDDRPYECSVCHRRFIQKINLKNHIMTHTGEKPFECGICSSGFIAKSDFKRHMNTHNEERNFECDLCHRRFTQMPYLKAHLSTHTSEKPYECNICQRRFSQKPYLKNHLKRHVQRE